MFRIVCDPSSGSTELCLTEITLSGSQIFFVCLVGVWQRNFEPAVCVYGTTGWEIVPSPSICSNPFCFKLFCYNSVASLPTRECALNDVATVVFVYQEAHILNIGIIDFSKTYL